MKHGRGTGGAAPASDATGRGDARGTPLPARPTESCHVAGSGSQPTRADSRRCGSDSGRFGLNQAVSADIGRYWPKRPKQPKF